jgi:hypothetical protein
LSVVRELVSIVITGKENDRLSSETPGWGKNKDPAGDLEKKTSKQSCFKVKTMM